MSTRKIIVVSVLILVIAAFAYGRIPGWRSLGIVAALYGALIIWRRRAAYGREALADGHYTGDAMAALVGFIVIAIGVVFLVAPDVIDHVYTNVRFRG